MESDNLDSGLDPGSTLPDSACLEFLLLCASHPYLLSGENITSLVMLLWDLREGYIQYKSCVVPGICLLFNKQWLEVVKSEVEFISLEYRVWCPIPCVFYLAAF